MAITTKTPNIARLQGQQHRDNDTKYSAAYEGSDTTAGNKDNDATDNAATAGGDAKVTPSSSIEKER